MRRRRGRRLLMELLLLLCRLFCRLLRCCFLRCHEISTPFQCQNGEQCVSGISEFELRVNFCLQDSSGRSEAGRRCASLHGKRLSVSKRWKEWKRGREPHFAGQLPSEQPTFERSSSKHSPTSGINRHSSVTYRTRPIVAVSVRLAISIRRCVECAPHRKEPSDGSYD